MKKFIVIFSAIFLILSCMIFNISCKSNNIQMDNEEPEHTLVGIWNTTSYTVLWAMSDEVAKEMKDDWLSTGTFIRITEHDLLFVDDLYNNCWPAYSLIYDYDSDKDIIKIDASGDPRYVKMTLCWYVNQDELICTYTNNIATVAIQLNK